MKTFGTIAGALGLLLVLSAPLTWAAGTGFLLAKLAVAAVLLAVFLVARGRDLAGLAAGKGARHALGSMAVTAVALAALVGVNVLAARHDRRWDLTANRIFSLAPQSEGALARLERPVHAIAFLPAGHPSYDALEELLARYAHANGGKFDYRFKDPVQDPLLAAQFGLEPGQSRVVLTQGDRHADVDVLSEQAFTQALLGLGDDQGRKVYVLAGHGEWPLQPQPDSGGSVSELARSLEREGYPAANLNLAGEREVPRDAALVLVGGARVALTANEQAALARYLDEGGHLAYFAEGDTATGLEPLLARYGFELDPGLVADAQYFSGSPYKILTLFYADHEITRPLAQKQLNLELPTVRGLSLLREGLDAGVRVEPLVFSSPEAWEETSPAAAPERGAGEKTGRIPLVAIANRPISTGDRRSEAARVLVFGDAELIADGNWGHEGNRNLVLNALRFAAGQRAEVKLRSPDREISTVELSPGGLARLRFVATDLLPLTLLGVGLAIWLTRRQR